MLTIAKLKTFGADTEDGLRRCMGLEDFYLDLVKAAVYDPQILQLETALNNGDLERAFEYAHALKGVYANLSLTPLSKPISELTELLRTGSSEDSMRLMNEAKEAFLQLRALLD